MVAEIIPSEGMQHRQTETIISRGSFTFPGSNSRPSLGTEQQASSAQSSLPSLLATFSNSVGVSISLCLFCWNCYHQPPPAHSIQDTISDGNLSPAKERREEGEQTALCCTRGLILLSSDITIITSQPGNIFIR